MIRLQALSGWLIALSMVLVLAQPTTALSPPGADSFAMPPSVLQDDDDDDDLDGVDDDLDDIDDGSGDNVDDDIDGDDRETPPPADPAPPESDDDDRDDSADDLDDIDDDVDDIDDDDPAPVAPTQDDDDDDDFDRPIANQAIVQLRPGTDPMALANRYGATVLRTIPGPNIVQVQLDPTLGDDDEVNQLIQDPDVVWGELNYTSQAPEGQPRYFFTSSTGEPQLVDGPSLPLGLEYSPESMCVSGEAIIVAVLDTGVDADHPALAGSVLPNGVNMIDGTFDVSDTGNGVDDDGDGRIDEMVGHGTHVSGIILQIAPQSRILPVRVLDTDGVGDTFSLTAGIYYAVEQGADVINLSLGSTFDSTAVRTAVEHSQENGVVVVAAAGNGNHQEPAEYPAAVPASISVAATTEAGDKAPYSNFHRTVDLSAPGNGVASAYPGGRYTTASGTSMSTPLVTATVALLLERQPGIDPERVLAVLQAAAGPLNLSDPSISGLMGAGEIDIDTSIACGG